MHLPQSCPVVLCSHSHWRLPSLKVHRLAWRLHLHLEEDRRDVSFAAPRPCPSVFENVEVKPGWLHLYCSFCSVFPLNPGNLMLWGYDILGDLHNAFRDERFLIPPTQLWEQRPFHGKTVSIQDPRNESLHFYDRQAAVSPDVGFYLEAERKLWFFRWRRAVNTNVAAP